MATESDLFPIEDGDTLHFAPFGALEEVGHEAAVCAPLAHLRDAENHPTPACFPKSAPVAPAPYHKWADDEKTIMSEDLSPETPVDPREARFTPVSPDKCRSRREYIMWDIAEHAFAHKIVNLVPRVPSVRVPLPAGIPESRLVYMSEFTLSTGWVVHVHPDGSLYLHHPQHRAVIEYPDNEAAFDDIVRESFLCMLALWMAFGRLPSDSQPNPEDCELFLRIDPKTEEILYYFVDYTRRHVFWVQEHSLDTPFAAFAQLASILEFQFWNHVERFPAHRRLPPGAQEELRGILVFQVIDVTTNTLSTAPYHPSDAALFIKSLENTREGSTAINGALNASVARLWGEQCRVRSHHLHGAPQVRIERTERRGMIALEPPRRWFQLIGLLLLFNEPYSFYKSLMDVFVDEVMYERFWKALYHDTLREEWGDHAFMATVSLAANMAFLTVGNVGGNGNSNNGNDALSPTSQVLSLCSTMFSIGAIVLGKSLPNFHRRLQRCSAIEVADWMNSFSKQHKDGLYKLAMLFSLPFALFMWSLALFVAALFSFAFEHWMWGTGMPVVIISGVILGVLTISLLFLRKEAGHFFIRPINRDPQPSVWGRCRQAVGAVPVRLRAGAHRFAMRFRNRMGERPESPGTDGSTVVGHSLEQLPASPTDTAGRSVEQMV